MKLVLEVTKRQVAGVKYVCNLPFYKDGDSMSAVSSVFDMVCNPNNSVIDENYIYGLVDDGENTVILDKDKLVAYIEVYNGLEDAFESEKIVEILEDLGLGKERCLKYGIEFDKNGLVD